MHTAVIGAGLAGLTCAQALQAQGHLVTVFEKSRGPSGRISTRRTEHGNFDHGAQYFTVRDARFAARVDQWQAQGIVAPWEGELMVFESDGSCRYTKTAVQRWVGIPGMSAIGHHMAVGLDLLTQIRIHHAQYTSAGWLLYAQEDKPDPVVLHPEPFGPFESLVLALPAEQAVQLMEQSAQHAEPSQPINTALLGIAQQVHTQPCWAVMLHVERSLFTHAGQAFDGAFVNDGALAWISRDSAKPGRKSTPSQAERWVLHASTQWTQAHLHDTPEQVIAQLQAALAQFVPNAKEPLTWAAAHRWLYSIAQQPLSDGSLWDSHLRLGLCGDWCCGSRVEGAYLSGLDMARQAS